jgi:hypothetical protein
VSSVAARALVAAVGAALCALTLAAVATADGGTPRDSYLGVSFHPFTTDGGNGACIPWSDPTGAVTRNCDPVNVLFPDQTLAQVEQRLAEHGWVPGSGSTQQLLFGGGSVGVPEDAQMIFPQDAADRFHVRLWQLPGFVAGAVHHDLGVTNHVVDIPWDVSEAFLATPICATWCEHIALPDQSAIEGGTGLWRGLPNDATATILPIAAPPPSPSVAPQHPVKHKKKHHPPRPGS